MSRLHISPTVLEIVLSGRVLDPAEDFRFDDKRQPGRVFVACAETAVTVRVIGV